MEHFESRGRFWLPEHPDRMVYGNLGFDDDDIRLQLTEALRPPAALAAAVGGGGGPSRSRSQSHGRFRDGMEVRGGFKRSRHSHT